MLGRETAPQSVCRASAPQHRTCGIVTSRVSYARQAGERATRKPTLFGTLRSAPAAVPASSSTGLPSERCSSHDPARRASVFCMGVPSADSGAEVELGSEMGSKAADPAAWRRQAPLLTLIRAQGSRARWFWSWCGAPPPQPRPLPSGRPHSRRPGRRLQAQRDRRWAPPAFEAPPPANCCGRQQPPMPERFHRPPPPISSLQDFTIAALPSEGAEAGRAGAETAMVPDAASATKPPLRLDGSAPPAAGAGSPKRGLALALDASPASWSIAAAASPEAAAGEEACSEGGQPAPTAPPASPPPGLAAGACRSLEFGGQLEPLRLAPITAPEATSVDVCGGSTPTVAPPAPPPPAPAVGAAGSQVGGRRLGARWALLRPLRQDWVQGRSHCNVLSLAGIGMHAKLMPRACRSPRPLIAAGHQPQRGPAPQPVAQPVPQAQPRVSGCWVVGCCAGAASREQAAAAPVLSEHGS